MQRFETHMDERLQKWIGKYIKQWSWGVPKWMDVDDLIQDANELFYKCVARYKDHPRVDSRARLIALFKSALFNRMVTLGKKNVRMPERFAADLCPEDENAVFDSALPQDGGFAELTALAPTTVRRLLKEIMDNPDRMTSPYRVRRGTRETTNERLCRIAGLDPATVNVVNELRAYLSN